MPGFLTTLARSVVLITALLCLPGPAVAISPWIDPGDRLTRHDIEVLKSFGLIDGPVSTWPMSWKQISRSLFEIDEYSHLPQHVQQSLLRLRAGLRRFEDSGTFGRHASFAGTNQERLIRDFSAGAREEGDVRSGFDAKLGRFYGRLSVGFRNDPETSDLNFDGSVLGAAFGNWLLYGGFQEQWFGPGFDSALILSTNAVPVPRVSIQRLDPKRIDLPVLRWLGPLQLNFTAGFDGDDRDDFDDVLLVFTRMSFEPLRGFQIGLSRGLQLCGAGRVCNAESFGRALVTVVDFVFQVGGDLDNTGEVLTDPGNQVAGLDFRYTRAVGPLSVTGYSEIASEDSSGPIAIGDVSLTVGGSLSGYLDRWSGLSWTVRGEATDSQSNRFFGINGVGQPGSANLNFIFTDGYSFQNRFLGPSIGPDGRLFTGEVSAIDHQSRLYFLRYRHIVLNGTGLTPVPTTFDRFFFDNLVSTNPERINLVEAGFEWPGFFGGKLRADLRLQDDQPSTPGVRDFQAAFELGWRLDF